MLFPSMRPVFRRELDVPVDAVTDEIRDALLQAPPDVVGSVAGTVVEIHIPRQDRHVFSPWLSVVVHRRDTTVVVGKYGPGPDVWTFFVALYALCFFSVIAGVIGGLSQQLLGRAPHAYLGVVVGLAGAACVYCAALVGRGAARKQVGALERFITQCIDRAATRTA